jgi:hypothetical protein
MVRTFVGFLAALGFEPTISGLHNRKIKQNLNYNSNA